MKAKGHFVRGHCEREELEGLAKKIDVELTTKIDVVEEGWPRKPKGLLQVLWERGWVNEEKLGEYSIKGMKYQMDRDRRIKREYSHFILCTFMGKCTDVREEKSAMEVLLDDLSSKSSNNQTISLLVSPKYYCEIAGEGIECCWGLSKKFFRNVGIEKKNTKKKFKNIIKAVIEYARQGHVEKFSAKCHQYMMAYTNAKNRNNELTYKWIERFVKQSKTHHNILDQERGFIEEVWRASILL